MLHIYLNNPCLVFFFNQNILPFTMVTWQHRHLCIQFVRHEMSIHWFIHSTYSHSTYSGFYHYVSVIALTMERVASKLEIFLLLQNLNFQSLQPSHEISVLILCLQVRKLRLKRDDVSWYSVSAELILPPNLLIPQDQGSSDNTRFSNVLRQ